MGGWGKGKDGACSHISALSGALKPQSRRFSQDSGGQRASRGNHLAGRVLNCSFMTRWRLGNACAVTGCPGPRGAGASQELCLGFLGSQGLGSGGSLLKACCTQGCGHRRCIHTCPGQPGPSQVSDVLWDRVELWGCDDVTQVASQINKPPPPPWPWLSSAPLSCPFP